MNKKYWCILKGIFVCHLHVPIFWMGSCLLHGCFSPGPQLLAACVREKLVAPICSSLQRFHWVEIAFVFCLRRPPVRLKYLLQNGCQPRFFTWGRLIFILEPNALPVVLTLGQSCSWVHFLAFKDPALQRCRSAPGQCDAGRTERGDSSRGVYGGGASGHPESEEEGSEQVSSGPSTSCLWGQVKHWARRGQLRALTLLPGPGRGQACGRVGLPTTAPKVGWATSNAQHQALPLQREPPAGQQECSGLTQAFNSGHEVSLK